MGLSTAELSYVEHQVVNDAPTVGLAYVLWFFGGLLSAHRFYVGKPGSAVLQILSYFVVVGFAWWLIDAFRISEMVDERKDLLRGRMVKQLAAARPDQREPLPRPSRVREDALFDRYRAT
jgi:TM2 domain-containing membrane protein YozV